MRIRGEHGVERTCCGSEYPQSILTGESNLSLLRFGGTSSSTLYFILHSFTPPIHHEEPSRESQSIHIAIVFTSHIHHAKAHIQ